MGMNIFRAVFSLLLVALLLSCARTMTEEEYQTISHEFTDRFVDVLFNPSLYEQEVDIEELILIVLEDVSRSHGHNAKSYMKKAEKLDEGWEDIWARIDNRLEEEFERIIYRAEKNEEEENGLLFE